MKPILRSTPLAVALTFSLCANAATNLLEEDYNQWKEALGTNSATATDHIISLPGFKVELIRSAKQNEGSWVAMTFDPQDRVIIAREDRGLLRFTLASNHISVAGVEIINANLLECRGLLFAHQALYANANNSKALVRLRDTDGDDQFDDIKILRSTPGGVGHGRNQLALGPDGMIYSIHGDDVKLPTNGVSSASPLRHYAEDRLLPCAWDKHLFNADAKMPFGHLIRTDRDGKTWELMSGGLRNPFGVDFNAAGHVFTFDADMEWDVGLSWYHPTRVLHLVPGGDYGWRRGTGVLPIWSPDTLPSAVDIGVGSPTAIKFGTRSNWPEPWRSALFILDWSYGKIIAVHMENSGASYTGHSEVFIKGRPLNVTGLEFGPDGAMYFITGGRRTQSGLYRVTIWPETKGRFRQEAKTAMVKSHLDSVNLAPFAPSRATSPADLWTRLNSNDHWGRYAARVELETTPATEWTQQAFTETNSFAALTALLALSRAGKPSLQTRIVNRIEGLSARKLNAEQQLIAVRALGVCFIRMGPPNRETANRLLVQWEKLYPTADARVNQSLCELLVYLQSTNVIHTTIPLLAAATQEEKFHYLFTLRLVTNGWSLDERRTYFQWLGRARTEFIGANMLPTALNYIRADAEATLSPAERADLSDLLLALNKPAFTVMTTSAPRAFIKEWTMADLGGVGHGVSEHVSKWAFETPVRQRPLTNSLVHYATSSDLARGKKLYTEIGCAQCHRLGQEGGFIGPDLTAVAARFDRRAILESIIEPSKVLAEIYRTATITLKSGAIYDGRIVTEDAASLVLALNPVDPDHRRRIAKSDIATQRVSEISPMPAGLVNTLTQDEILDLLAWIETGGTQRKVDDRSRIEISGTNNHPRSIIHQPRSSAPVPVGQDQ